MKARLHTCRAAGCVSQVSFRMLMCLDHWRMVPAPMQREIRAAARDVSNGGWQRYFDAVNTAIAAVKRKQEEKTKRAAGGSADMFP